jgi:hypothetical protein
MPENQTTKNGDTEDEGPRDFGRILALLDEGVALCQLSEELQALTKAVVAQGKARQKTVAGRITLTLTLASDETGVVEAAYDISRKDPKPKRSTSLFWTTKGGNLTEHNPRQQVLPLREVAGGRAAPRDLDQEPAAAREV